MTKTGPLGPRSERYGPVFARTKDQIETVYNKTNRPARLQDEIGLWFGLYCLNLGTKQENIPLGPKILVEDNVYF